MLDHTRHKAIDIVRMFFEDIAYRYLCHSRVPQAEGLMFGNFTELEASCRALSSFHLAILTLFRQGSPLDDLVVRKHLPARFLEACVDCGLLSLNTVKQWITPSIAILPYDGLLLAVSLPPEFPNSTDRSQPIYIGFDSLALTRALPSRISGTVLDVCSGSGVQGLICAMRGASQVVCIEAATYACIAIAFNARLNGLASVISTRHSNLYSAVEEGESFNLIISNPPFMPICEGIQFPLYGNGGIDGTSILRGVIIDLPRYLSSNGSAYIYCNVLGNRSQITFNENFLWPVLKRSGLHCKAFVSSRQSFVDYVSRLKEELLQLLIPSVEQLRETSALVDKWAADFVSGDTPAINIYEQLLVIEKSKIPLGNYSQTEFYSSS